MNGGFNFSAISSFKNIRLSRDAHFQNLGRISSGKKLVHPGDYPVGYGIAQKIKSQIGNGKAARGNIDEAMMMVSSMTSWIGEVRQMVCRMAELSASAKDDSKTVEDKNFLI